MPLPSHNIQSVGQLLAALHSLDASARIMLATRYPRPGTVTIGGMLTTGMGTETDGSDEPTVWLAEGTETGPLPSPVAGALGWPHLGPPDPSEPHSLEPADNSSATVWTGLARQARRAYTMAYRDDSGDGQDDPEQPGPLHVHLATTLAATLRIPDWWVTVTDDPDHGHRVPGSVPLLLTVTEPGSDDTWQFIPDTGRSGDEFWYLLDVCSDCGVAIPAVRFATLAGLGSHIDPDTGDLTYPAEPYLLSPQHHAECPWGPAPRNRTWGTTQ